MEANFGGGGRVGGLPVTPPTFRFLQSSANVSSSSTTRSCALPDEFWDPSRGVCSSPCHRHNDDDDSFSGVRFVPNLVEVDGVVAGRDETQQFQVSLHNGELFDVFVYPEDFPEWMALSPYAELSDSLTGTLLSGDCLVVDVSVNSTSLPAEVTTRGFVSFGVELNVGCDNRNQTNSNAAATASFEVLMDVKRENRNYVDGWMRALGLSIMTAVCMFCLLIGAWVYAHGESNVIQHMQPTFLYTLLVGIFILVLTILPLSIDDSIASQRVCDIACMLRQWTAAVGLTVSFSGLFSKLWRVNKLFHNRRFRRITVRAIDVLIPFAILFTGQLAVLVVWTFVDPLVWIRVPIHGQDWNTVAYCGSPSHTAVIYHVVIDTISGTAFVLLCYQAFKARNISPEFSESRSIFWGLLSWLQLLVLGYPLLYMIGPHDTDSLYFRDVASVVGGTLSLLVAVFAPMFAQFHIALRGRNGNHLTRLRITGPHEPETPRTPHNTLVSNASPSNETKQTLRGETTESARVSSLQNEVAALELLNKELEDRRAKLDGLVEDEPSVWSGVLTDKMDPVESTKVSVSVLVE